MKPWPPLICLLLIAGLIAGLELQAIDHGIDGRALSAAIGALGVIAGIIGSKVLPLKRKLRGGPGAER